MLFRNLTCCVEIHLGSFPGKFYQYQQAAVASHFPRRNCTKAQAMPQTESQRWHHKRQGSHNTCSVHKGRRTSLRPDPLKTQGSGSTASREDDAALSQFQGDQPPSNPGGQDQGLTAQTRRAHWAVSPPCPPKLMAVLGAIHAGCTRQPGNRGIQMPVLPDQGRASVSRNTSKRHFQICHLILATTWQG